MYFLILDRLPARAWWLVTAILLTALVWYTTVVGFAKGWMFESDWIRGLINCIGSLTGCIGVLALWGLGLRCRFFSRKFWEYLLLMDVGTFIFSALLRLNEMEKYPLALFAVTGIPYYLGMYWYAFRSDDLWHRREQARPNLARWVLLALLAAAFLAIYNYIQYSVTSGYRHQRMSAIMGEISMALYAYENTHGGYPESLHSLSFANSPLESEIRAHVRKIYYCRLDKGGFWLGYYEDGGYSDQMTSGKNTNEAQQSAPANGAPPRR